MVPLIGTTLQMNLNNFKIINISVHFCAAETLGVPYLSAYLDSIGTNFSHGANFATGGSSIRPGGYSPFHLGLQISHFVVFLIYKF